MSEPATVLEGLAFPEGPRWHDGRLFFSDQHAHQVLALAPDGTVEEIVRVEHQPSGLGWTPDGHLLIVSMIDRRLLRLEPGAPGAPGRQGSRLVEVADLSAQATFHCNDMVVSADGRAYVGNFGFDLDAGERPRPATIIAVDPDGTASTAAEEMQFPNGSVITPDGRTLIVGETVAGRLTAFTIEPDGRLTDRRVWAQLEGALPDGICLDAEGAIWLACPLSRRCLRVAEGGEVLEEIATEQSAFACMLGGDDRRTLYICTSEMATSSETVSKRPGRIRTRTVDVAGAGLP
jgi:sugar lactone lactonase YvrE